MILSHSKVSKLIFLFLLLMILFDLEEIFYTISNCSSRYIPTRRVRGSCGGSGSEFSPSYVFGSVSTGINVWLVVVETQARAGQSPNISEPNAP